MAFENFQFAKFEVATFCTQGPSRGALAVMAYVLDRFDFASNMGIFKCRGTGSGSLSHHAEGRACDIGIPTKANGDARPELGLQIVNLFGPHAKTLGFDHTIYNLGGSGRGKPYIWSAKDANGRPYTGVDPHENHIHNGLNRNAAKNLTYAKLEDVLGPANAPVPPVTPPTPPTPPSEEDDLLPLTPSSSREDIRKLQLLFNQTYNQGLTVDGVWGDSTSKAVRDRLFPYTGAENDPKATAEMKAGREVNAAMHISLQRDWVRQVQVK